MMTGKVVGLGFEIISKLDSYFLMTVLLIFTFFRAKNLTTLLTFLQQIYLLVNIPITAFSNGRGP